MRCYRLSILCLSATSVASHHYRHMLRDTNTSAHAKQNEYHYKQCCRSVLLKSQYGVPPTHVSLAIPKHFHFSFIQQQMRFAFTNFQYFHWNKHFVTFIFSHFLYSYSDCICHNNPIDCSFSGHYALQNGVHSLATARVTPLPPSPSHSLQIILTTMSSLFGCWLLLPGVVEAAIRSECNCTHTQNWG